MLVLEKSTQIFCIFSCGKILFKNHYLMLSCVCVCIAISMKRLQRKKRKNISYQLSRVIYFVGQKEARSKQCFVLIFPPIRNNLKWSPNKYVLLDKNKYIITFHTGYSAIFIKWKYDYCKSSIDSRPYLKLLDPSERFLSQTDSMFMSRRSQIFKKQWNKQFRQNTESSCLFSITIYFLRTKTMTWVKLSVLRNICALFP